MKNETKQQIEKALKYDALSEAEKLTGKSYKEDKLTGTIGFMDFMKSNKKKKDLLLSVNDTVFSETEESYMKKVADFGFKEVLTIPFINEHGIEERLHIMFHDKYSILLQWDTHTWKDDGSWARAGEQVPPPSRNGGSFYYNWTPSSKLVGSSITSSGGYISHSNEHNTYTCWFNEDLTPHELPKYLRDKEPGWKGNSWEEFSELNKQFKVEVDNYLVDKSVRNIWSGNHDCREALKFNINRLAENGTFLKKWKERPPLWLEHYMDRKAADYSHEQIAKDRIAMLPKYIQEIIGGE